VLWGEPSDWIGGSDEQRVTAGYIQRPPANGGKLWVDCDVYLGRDAFIVWLGALRKATAAMAADADAVTPLVALPPPPPSPEALPQPKGEKGLALLRAFYERFQNGLTQSTQAAEYGIISKTSFEKGAAPKVDTWERNVRPYWKKMTWAAGRWQMDPQTTAAIERATRK
jgi:hypothetical protein